MEYDKSRRVEMDGYRLIKMKKFIAYKKDDMNIFLNHLLNISDKQKDINNYVVFVYSQLSLRNITVVETPSL